MAALGFKDLALSLLSALPGLLAPQLPLSPPPAPAPPSLPPPRRPAPPGPTSCVPPSSRTPKGRAQLAPPSRGAGQSGLPTVSTSSWEGRPWGTRRRLREAGGFLGIACRP